MQSVIPRLTALVFGVAAIWMFVAMVIAVRQALDYRGTLRAVGVYLIGRLVQVVILVLLSPLMGGPA